MGGNLEFRLGRVWCVVLVDIRVKKARPGRGHPHVDEAECVWEVTGVLQTPVLGSKAGLAWWGVKLK